ncbi:putative dimethylaniline monooxygenase [Aspergillus candidus]|uniref:Putative dimethylaniline monooxygenase n=1 Tax=Aspergillus candidus TaxID=41067 RepID=A0A2I2FB80_ASPCN|nr:putative dimethylaniline monooxygenase [Aspergillus candidus]PLB37864.1 putative dimethylaniline monooxygenase [Aspergillus candidus]
MARYPRVAVVGTGPSGISAVKALHEEKAFDTIRVFERRNKPGGVWHLDPIPDVFPAPKNPYSARKQIPSTLPQFSAPGPEDTTARTGVYESLDSNVGIKAMEFTHTPFPVINSALSVERYGHSNPTRPWQVVSRYLDDLAKDYLHLISFNTTVERVKKIGGKWTVTLRRTDMTHHGQPADYWWQEHFDAVIVASGHYNVPLVPEVKGLDAAFKAHPTKLEHAKSFRSANDYVDKKVVVVGGNVSSADLVADLHAIIKGPLYVSQRGRNDAFRFAWDLPNVELKPTLQSIKASDASISVTFTDNTTVDNIDKLIFATGYRLSYPFLDPDPVTPNNRVAGFYQHVFKVGDPSLALVGQVRAAISFRVYEYQAVAVARYFAGHNAKPLPSPQKQDLWEFERLKYRGPTTDFHTLRPDFKEYFDFLRDLAGPPAAGTDGYELPSWDDKWAEWAWEIPILKERYWRSRHQDKTISNAVRAKL